MRIPALLLGLACLGAASGGPKPMQQLLSDLRYGTPEVREAAIDALAAGGAPKSATGALLEALEDSEGTVKLKIVQALGSTRDSLAVGPLVSLLADPQPEFRSQAAAALGRIADASAAQALEARLADGDSEVRAAAALALGRCGAKGSLNKILPLLKDKSRLLRLAAVDALGLLGEPASLPELKSQLSDKDPAYRRHVIKAIGSLRAGEEVGALLASWLEDGDPYLRGFSAEALALRPANAAARKKLVALLGDPVLAVRIRAAETLGAWKSREAVPQLKKMLRDGNATLRWKAALALGAIADPAASDALKYLAENDEELEVRQAAAASLDQVGAAAR